MQEVITITPQWQAYIPKKARDKLGWEKPGKAQLVVKDSALTITPKESQLMKLGGKYAGRKPRTDLANIRDQIDYSNL